MSKAMLLLLAGIISAWLVMSFITKEFNEEFLLILLFGVFLGYGVGRREVDKE